MLTRGDLIIRIFHELTHCHTLALSSLQTDSVPLVAERGNQLAFRDHGIAHIFGGASCMALRSASYQEANNMDHNRNGRRCISESHLTRKPPTDQCIEFVGFAFLEHAIPAEGWGATESNQQSEQHYGPTVILRRR